MTSEREGRNKDLMCSSYWFAPEALADDRPEGPRTDRQRAAFARQPQRVALPIPADL